MPSRWPPSRSLEAVASTWLKDCDVVTIAVCRSAFKLLRRVSATTESGPPRYRRDRSMVSGRQAAASRGATVARRKSARKFITRNVAVTHDDTGFTPWLPIRAAVEWAAARRGFDWLAMVEDDSVLHLKRLRAFLGRFASSDPLTFGQCACDSLAGMHFFSRAALDQLRPVVGTCAPGRYKAQAAGDVALLKCLDRANLTCTPAVDARGDALISAMRSQRKPQMLRLLEATRAGRRHCEAGKPSEPCTKGGWRSVSIGRRTTSS